MNSAKAVSEPAATSEPSEDEGEEEVDNDELEEDDEGVAAVEGAAASKTYVPRRCVSSLLILFACSLRAEAALLRIKDVDIPGGWKVGQP